MDTNDVTSNTQVFHGKLINYIIQTTSALEIKGSWIGTMTIREPYDEMLQSARSSC